MATIPTSTYSANSAAGDLAAAGLAREPGARPAAAPSAIVAAPSAVSSAPASPADGSAGRPASPPHDWIIAPPHEQRGRLSQEARIAPLLAQLLLNRGVESAADVRRFLHPDFLALRPPGDLPGAADAGRRLADAVRAGRRIVIYGDYDVDGVTATALLWHALTLAGANVGFYIPSRADEGYGLNGDALEKIAAEGPALVVTVDCGITALEEAQQARRLGLELIVTDHHEPRATLPDAALIVHPTATGEPCENPHLSGAGVALKVAWAFALEICGTARVDERFREFLMDATALAALGLVADVVPLTGENRIIASFGLRQLRTTHNPGLNALIDVAGLREKRAAFDDYDVGFLLAPRLNAVGRMGHARLAVELFTRADGERAAEIARTLDGLNRERQGVERDIVRRAEALAIERGCTRESCRAIVLADAGWHVGVIGIAAARLVERFCRPTVLIAMENGVGQGSARSIRHFPLHEALACCSRHLLSHGGHAMAAGVRVRADQVEAFADAFVGEAARRLTPADLRPKLHLDDEIDLEELVAGAIEPLQRMAPFGVGNARPRLATREVELVEAPRVVGKARNHLQFTVRQGGAYRKAIAFNRGDQAAALADHSRLRLAFEPLINEWNGQRRVEMKVIDWKW